MKEWSWLAVKNKHICNRNLLDKVGMYECFKCGGDGVNYSACTGRNEQCTDCGGRGYFSDPDECVWLDQVTIDRMASVERRVADSVYRDLESGRTKLWFAWYPVKVHVDRTEKWVWFRQVIKERYRVVFTTDGKQYKSFNSYYAFPSIAHLDAETRPILNSLTKAIDVDQITQVHV